MLKVLITIFTLQNYTIFFHFRKHKGCSPGCPCLPCYLREHRNPFYPTLWEWPDSTNSLKTLKQFWFPGTHSNIGGSYADAGISNITLAWMIG